MSNFVSAGTDQESQKRDDEWLSAQRAIETRRLAKLDAGKQEGGKSLYETLQANKEAKQEAFEESIRLKHQFRSLDEDEVDFLDGIARAARAKEAEARRADSTQLESFRAQQEEAERTSKLAESSTEPAAVEVWSTSSRKRKKERDFAGIVKKRQLDGDAAVSAAPVASNVGKVDEQSKAVQEFANAIKPAASSIPQASMPTTIAQTTSGTKQPLLGLADYSSDDDD